MLGRWRWESLKSKIEENGSCNASPIPHLCSCPFMRIVTHRHLGPSYLLFHLHSTPCIAVSPSFTTCSQCHAATLSQSHATRLQPRPMMRDASGRGAEARKVKTTKLWNDQECKSQGLSVVEFGPGVCHLNLACTLCGSPAAPCEYRCGQARHGKCEPPERPHSSAWQHTPNLFVAHHHFDVHSFAMRRAPFPFPLSIVNLLPLAVWQSV